MAVTSQPTAGDMRHRRHVERDAVRNPQHEDDDERNPLHEDEDERKQHTTPVPHALGLMLGFVAFYVLGLSFVAYSHAWLPTPLPIDAPEEVFSEARARVVLENIMSFGYHPVGTRANEELIPGYLVAEVRRRRQR